MKILHIHCTHNIGGAATVARILFREQRRAGLDACHVSGWNDGASLPVPADYQNHVIG